MTPILLAGPSIEPVSLVEAKSWLRIDGSDEDQLVSALIVSARLTLEAYTRRFFISQNWRLKLDAWPKGVLERMALVIPFAPFQSVTAIRVFDADGAPLLLDAATYMAPAAPDCGRISFTTAPSPPGRASDGVELDIVVGYGDNANDPPDPLRRAILMLAAYWFENRGDHFGGAAGLSPEVRSLASPFRRERLV